MFDRVLSASPSKAKCFQNCICDFSKQLPCPILFFLQYFTGKQYYYQKQLDQVQATAMCSINEAKQQQP